jgi:hypothetical protein
MILLLRKKTTASAFAAPSLWLGGIAALLVAGASCKGDESPRGEDTDESTSEPSAATDTPAPEDETSPLGSCSGAFTLQAAETDETGLELARLNEDNVCRLAAEGHRRLYVGCMPADTKWRGLNLMLRYLEPGTLEDLDRHVDDATVTVSESVRESYMYLLTDAAAEDVESFRIEVHEADYEAGNFHFDIEATYQTLEHNAEDGATPAQVSFTMSTRLQGVPECT